jgi:hypothetical protein
MAARRWRDGGGASAQDGDGVGLMRTERRRVRRVGIFIGGQGDLLWGGGEAGEGRGAFMASVEGASMTGLEGTGYHRIEEGRGHHLMGEMKRT